MTSTMEQEQIHTLEIRKEESINAPIEIAFQALLEELGPESTMPDGKPYPMKLEAWPGGRWFRDLGNNTGHLWGNVQVIKPPTLLEIIGPMPMSYPAMNHVQYRLTAEGNITRLAFMHKGMGMISQDHRDGMPQGWGYKLSRVRILAEQLKNAGVNGKAANR
ncbi:MAG TPA: SRPBCC domain-containing protein [Phycisphaerales bacterium]|nr:SRPBCC domain-containing protein [Phycisphaerales bacterium]